MSIQVPSDVKIVVLEGVPGAGKTTLHNQLKDSLEGKLVYDFHEEELLWSWKHGWIPGIDELRMSFMEKFLEYCQNTIAEHAEAVFILNRFHISYHLLALEDAGSNPRYLTILKILKGLGTHIYVPLVSVDEIEKRAAHVERQDPVWQMHLQKRLAQKGFATLTAMYSDEQEKIKHILETQGLQYSLISVAAPTS